MSLRLRNQKDPSKILGLTHAAWYGILDLAEVYGWNPMGTVHPVQWQVAETDLGGYDPESWLEEVPDAWGDAWDDGWDNVWETEEELDGRLVMLEDALNLADALDRAFLEYEPRRVRVYDEDPYADFLSPVRLPRPSIGVIQAVAGLAYNGAFWIEKM